MSRLEEADPAQIGELRLTPTDEERSTTCGTGDKRSPAIKFLTLCRGLLESGGSYRYRGLDDGQAQHLRPNRFKERVLRLGEIMSDLAKRHREANDTQPGELKPGGKACHRQIDFQCVT